MLTHEQWQKLTPKEMLEFLPMRAKFAQKKAKTMSEVKRIKKSGYNAFHKYEYATEADVKNEIRSIFFDNGLSFDVDLVEHSRNGDITTAVLDCTLTDTETGYFETRRIIGDGQDKNDKGIYKAYAGGIKYFLMTTFLIPTGEDPEQDNPGDKKPTKQNNQGQPRQQQPPPQNNQAGPKLASEPQIKKLNTVITELAKFGGTADMIKDTLRGREKVGAFDSLKDLTVGQASEAIKIVEGWIKNKKEKQNGGN